MNFSIAHRQLRLSSLLITISYVAVFSAILFSPSMHINPLSITTAWFLIGMLETPALLARISDRSERRVFLVKQTVRSLYSALGMGVLTLLQWSHLEFALVWMVFWTPIMFLPQLVYLILKHRKAFGSRDNRLLEILDYVMDTDQSKVGTTG